MRPVLRVLLAAPAALVILCLLLILVRQAYGQAQPGLLNLQCFKRTAVEAVLLERDGALGLIEGQDAEGNTWRWYYAPKAGLWHIMIETRDSQGAAILCPVKSGEGARGVSPSVVPSAPLQAPHNPTRRKEKPA